ncbi:MAG: sigma-70 family RNA polymerase sigma factor [Planctomycetia bacterium]|nr:sigma-70 family RNA polymerase sigma factor [Planctomycetia bacterium]
MESSLSLTFSERQQLTARPEAPTDTVLIQAVLAGEVTSYEELVRRYHGMILRYFLLYHRHEDALDLTQETFLRAWQALKTYNAKWKFSTWLLAIAHQQNALFFRNQSRLLRAQTGFGNESLSEMVVTQEHAGFQEILQQEEHENLWKTIRKILPQEQAEALWFFYVEEKNQQEIAQILGRTVGGVKTILFRARQVLQKTLKMEI